MTALDPAEAEPADTGFVRARRLATGVLCAMVAIYIATHFMGDSATVRLIRAMAEAGMIGGLADWFAVEALFRRPLGLPIPHTALLPRNQQRAARNLGRFFERHFLEPDNLRLRLQALKPGSIALGWLAGNGNAELVAKELTRIVGHLLQQDLSPRALVRSRRWLRAQAATDENDRVIAETLTRLVKQGVKSAAVDEILVLVRDAIDRNRDRAVALVQERSRWWIASAVDRRVAGAVVDGVLSLLDELRDGDSDLRHDFESAVHGMVDQLASDGTLTRGIESGREALARSGALEATALRLATALRDRLRERIATDPDALAVPIADLLRELAVRAQTDDATRDALDQRLADLAAALIADMRPAIAEYVADVIAGWEPKALIERFETEIGRDLQYIRINGAVLGALIGGALFALNAIIS